MSSVTPATPPASIAEPITQRITAAWRAGFIVSPPFDLFYFILSPILGLIVIKAIVMAEWSWVAAPETLMGVRDSKIGFAIGVWTYAHLFAVVFRSHVNTHVFSQHRIRFVVVPVVLCLGFIFNPWILAIGLMATLFWDLYHSSMQVFGFSRIYDSKFGNPPEKGRLLDVWMAHVLYIAPVFVGLSLNKILNSASREFTALGWNVPSELVDPIIAAQPVFAQVVTIASGLFIIYYILAYWRLSQQGYKYSPQKALALVSTGATTIYAWGFMHPVGAFLVVNFFHALQYFAIVWWSEKKNITATFRLPEVAWGHVVSLLLFIAIIFGVGLWMRTVAYAGPREIVALSVATVIALMHFWYDGFIWSVRKHEV